MTEASAAQQTRAAREAARRDDFMRVAARVFRDQGLTGGTMEQVAAAAGVTKVVLYRRFASKEQLIQAIFTETIRRLRAGDAQPWPGYGAGFRRSLAAARSFEDGYILLVREAGRQGAYQAYHQTLRRRTAQRLTALLWHPEPPPPRPLRPALLDLALDPMVSFSNEALAYWVEHGDPRRDSHYIRWCGQMIRAWRHNAAELLDLDTPEADWPFEADLEPPPA